MLKVLDKYSERRDKDPVLDMINSGLDILSWLGVENQVNQEFAEEFMLIENMFDMRDYLQLAQFAPDLTQ